MSDEEKPDLSQIDESKIAGRRPDLARLLMSYMACEEAIHRFFGYEPSWRVIPISDNTAYWWWLSGEGSGDYVIFGEGDVKEAIKGGQYYSNEIYTQRHLSRWVYRAESHTMICVDTRTDMNVFLAIFDNEKKVRDPDLVSLIEEHA